MNRLSDNDRNFGPFTLANWSKTFSAHIESSYDEDPESTVLIIAFGWALRIRVWKWLCRPWRERWVECHWDAETIKRLGRSGYWQTHPRRFGFGLSDMGNGYDFLQVFYGPQTHDSSTTKSWCTHLPWKEWRHVRHSLYTPAGDHFYTRPQDEDFSVYMAKEDQCPKSVFQFSDYDGEIIIARCTVEEREWLKGRGWFKWLSWFYRPKIHRSLDIKFSNEVGPEKGSWKGGTIGHGIGMLPGETPRQAFERYCAKDHERKGRTYRLKFMAEIVGTSAA